MATVRVIESANRPEAFTFSGGFRRVFVCCCPIAGPAAESTPILKKTNGLEGGVSSVHLAAVASRSDEYVGQSRLNLAEEGGGGGVTEGGRVDGREEDGWEKGSDSAIDTCSTHSLQIRGYEERTARTELELENRQEEQQLGQFSQPNNGSNEYLGTPGNASESREDIDNTDDKMPDAAADADAEVKETDATALECAVENEENTHTQCGKIRVTYKYDSDRQRIVFIVHEASDVPNQERGSVGSSQIRFLLLPKRNTRHKTKVKAGDNPQFEETFHFKLPSDDLPEAALRMRFYRTGELFKKERLIGERTLSMSFLGFDQDTPFTVWIELEPRSNLIHGSALSLDDVTDGVPPPTQSQMSTLSQTGGSQLAELLVGLSYNGTTGRMSVEVGQGSNFKSPDSTKPPDTYVKLKLMSPDGKELSRSKTSVRKNQPNPFFKETFMFHVPQFQLPDVSLMVSVVRHHSIKHNQMLGWFTLGHTNSSDETRKHWSAMIENKGESIGRWHILLNP